MFKFLGIVLFSFAMMINSVFAADFYSQPPHGYTAFMEKNPNLLYPGWQNWDVDLELLKKVNKEINQIPYQFEETDVWGEGSDCEDYAIRKMLKLLEAGVPRGAMRLAYTTVNGQGHAVLVIKETLVLDNNLNEIKKVSDYPERIKSWEDENGTWNRVVKVGLDALLK